MAEYFKAAADMLKNPKLDGKIAERICRAFYVLRSGPQHMGNEDVQFLISVMADIAAKSIIGETNEYLPYVVFNENQKFIFHHTRGSKGDYYKITDKHDSICPLPINHVLSN